MNIESTQDSARAFFRLYTQAVIDLKLFPKQIRQEMAVQHHFADGTCEGLAEDGRDASERGKYTFPPKKRYSRPNTHLGRHHCASTKPKNDNVCPELPSQQDSSAAFPCSAFRRALEISGKMLVAISKPVELVIDTYNI